MKYIEITQGDIDKGLRSWIRCDKCILGRALGRVGLLWTNTSSRIPVLAVADKMSYLANRKVWLPTQSLIEFHKRLSTHRPGYIVLDNATMTASYVERLPLQPDWSAIVRRAQEDVAAEAHEYYQGVEV